MRDLLQVIPRIPWKGEDSTVYKNVQSRRSDMHAILIYNFFLFLIRMSM